MSLSGAILKLQLAVLLSIYLTRYFIIPIKTRFSFLAIVVILLLALLPSLDQQQTLSQTVVNQSSYTTSLATPNNSKTLNLPQVQAEYSKLQVIQATTPKQFSVLLSLSQLAAFLNDGTQAQLYLDQVKTLNPNHPYFIKSN